MATLSRKRRRRRFLQFTLRSLLVFVLLVSMGMSWFAVKLAGARRQREAVEAIERMGGRVSCHYEFGTPSGGPLVPRWARALVGDDIFLGAVEVRAPRSFGDEEASYLKALTNLTSLNLNKTQVTGRGLEHLRGLTNLTYLNLSGTEITDAALEHLEGLTNLERLDVTHTEVTDAGLEHLEGLTGLSDLYLGDTEITDAGLEHLEGLTNLKRLELAETEITDAGLAHLKELSGLKNLGLSGTKITDAGVVDLAGLTTLTYLDVNDTEITFEGRRRLLDALPRCSIVIETPPLLLPPIRLPLPDFVRKGGRGGGRSWSA